MHFVLVISIYLSNSRDFKLSKTYPMLSATSLNLSKKCQTAPLFSEILLFHRRKPSHKVCQIKGERTERILTLLSYPSSIILWKVVLSSYPHCGLFHENLNCYNICLCVCEKYDLTDTILSIELTMQVIDKQRKRDRLGVDDGIMRLVWGKCKCW